MALEAPSLLALAPASDSGSIGDKLTNFTTPDITGIGEVGATVTLLDGVTTIGSGKVSAGGTWSIVTAALAGGLHSITAVQTQVGSISGPSAAFALTIDTALPAAPLGLLLTQSSDSGVQGDNLTKKSNPTISGTGEIGATVTLRDVGSAIGTGVVGATGTWFIAAITPLGAGINRITATQTDAAGNASAASAALDVTLDTVALPPADLALAPGSDSATVGDNTTNVPLPTFTGSGEEGATVTLRT